MGIHRRPRQLRGPAYGRWSGSGRSRRRFERRSPPDPPAPCRTPAARSHRTPRPCPHVPAAATNAPHQVARPRKRRHPAARQEHGVPADMIHVLMRAQHGVDRLPRQSRRCRILQERPVQIVPRRYPPALLVVAQAGVQHDPPPSASGPRNCGCSSTAGRPRRRNAAAVRRSAGSPRALRPAG
jgi:hypothetical protein